jgi:hypothetical protein
MEMVSGLHTRRAHLMLVNIRRAFNLHLGRHCDLHQTMMVIGPGAVDVPDEAAEHWYFKSNIQAGNIIILENVDASPSHTELT